MSLSLQSIIARNPEIITSEIDDEIVMMSIEEGKYFGLNAIGSAIWGLLEQEQSIEAIIAALLKRFDVSEVQCQAESLSFIKDMIGKNTLLVK